MVDAGASFSLPTQERSFSTPPGSTRPERFCQQTQGIRFRASQAGRAGWGERGASEAAVPRAASAAQTARAVAVRVKGAVVTEAPPATRATGGTVAVVVQSLSQIDSYPWSVASCCSRP